jgi:UDP-sulfoquinovose synthase
VDLGYVPTHDVRTEIRHVLEDLLEHSDRIDERRHVLLPDVRWDGRRQRVRYLQEELV